MSSAEQMDTSSVKAGESQPGTVAAGASDMERPSAQLLPELGAEATVVSEPSEDPAPSAAPVSSDDPAGAPQTPEKTPLSGDRRRTPARVATVLAEPVAQPLPRVTVEPLPGLTESAPNVTVQLTPAGPGRSLPVVLVVTSGAKAATVRAASAGAIGGGRLPGLTATSPAPAVTVSAAAVAAPASAATVSGFQPSAPVAKGAAPVHVSSLSPANPSGGVTTGKSQPAVARAASATLALSVAAPAVSTSVGAVATVGITQPAVSRPASAVPVVSTSAAVATPAGGTVVDSDQPAAVSKRATAIAAPAVSPAVVAPAGEVAAGASVASLALPPGSVTPPPVVSATPAASASETTINGPTKLSPAEEKAANTTGLSAPAVSSAPTESRAIAEPPSEPRPRKAEPEPGSRGEQEMESEMAEPEPESEMAEPEPRPEQRPEPVPEPEARSKKAEQEMQAEMAEPEPEPAMLEPEKPESEMAEPKKPESGMAEREQPQSGLAEPEKPQSGLAEPEKPQSGMAEREQRSSRRSDSRRVVVEPPPPPARVPAPEVADAHCLVCNDPVEAGGGGSDGGSLQLSDYLENAHVRIEDKLSGIINNDYRLYLHSELVCGRCHTTLCQIQDLEMQTKHLKDQVVGFFWDTVEVRRVRPQRKGRRKSRPSKLLLESQETDFFMPEEDIQEPAEVIQKAPQKKMGRWSKPKCYEKLSHNEYQCIRCHKVLPRMRAVVKHFDLVHGPKEEQCKICDKFFRDRPHLTRHMQKMHPEAADSTEPAVAVAASDSLSLADTSTTDLPPAASAGAALLPAALPLPPATGPAVKLEHPDISSDLLLAAEDDCPPEDVEDAEDEDYVADRAPVIEDDDDLEDDAMMEEVDMDVVMNVEVERQVPRRGRKRRFSSQSSILGNEVGVMYTENADGSSPRFKCMVCPNTYSRAAKARDHFIAKHAQIKRFRCTMCPEMFYTYKQKRHHELSHTAEACPKCGKKYPGNRRGMLERHVAQCGELKRCRICGAEFQNLNDFIKHRRDVHEKNATCDICGKIVSARNLASHRAIHSDERNYTCHLCGSSFKAKGSLDTHLRTHSEDRPFSCETCGKSFKHRNNWKDHERGHLNIRDFVCHFCSKSFKQAKNLKQHLRQHDANPEIFTCPHCPSTFRYKYNMLAHVKTLHTGETNRRVRRRMRAPSELSVAGSASGSGHPVLVGLDPLQLSPGSVTSDSNSGMPAGPGPAQQQAPSGSRSLPQLNPLNPGVVFMQTLQHHSIFS